MRVKYLLMIIRLIFLTKYLIMNQYLIELINKYIFIIIYVYTIYSNIFNARTHYIL